MKKARQNEVKTSFDHAIIVDEAHNIFLKKPTNFSNESVTDMIYREMREYGTSLICLDQHISKISDTVKGNSACHIAFQQQLPQDIMDISGIMDIRDNKNYFTQLKVGNAIVKLAERYTSPFLIDIPEVVLRNESFTNEQVESRMKALMMNRDYKNKVDPKFNKAIEEPKPVKIEVPEVKKNVTVQNDNGFSEVQQMIYEFVGEHLKAGVSLEKIEQTLEKSKSQGEYTSADILKVINHIFENQLVVTFKKDRSSNNSELGGDAQVFVEFLEANPNHNFSTVEVYQKIGLSTRKGTNIKNELLEKGLIKIEEIKYEKGWKKIIRLSN